MNNKSGTLFIVATPIGNLSDITLRALETLKSVDIIACEDTRVTGNLLHHFEIKKPTISYFQHSKLSKIEKIIDELKSGKNIALVTDAGTPGISDPGEYLISQIRKSCHSERCQESGHSSNPDPSDKPQDDKIQIIPIPGASALTAAASVSGMIEKEFFFAGFLPKKKGRQTKFKEISNLSCPVIVYESAMRLERTLEDFKLYFGEDCQVFIAREVTKMFEEYWGGKIDDVMAELSSHKQKGEIVLIVNRSK